MNVKHENVPGQVQELVVEIKKEDYAENLEKALKKQRREANVPGFRKGNAPMGIINKMYGKTLLAYEVDRLVDEQIKNFFKENNIKHIFEPLPIEEKSKVDFDNPDNFEFAYEYALYPDFEINYDELPAIQDVTVVPTQDEIEKSITELRKRHGKYVNPEEVAEDDDSVSLDFGGEREAFLFIRDLTDDAKKIFIGKKVNDKFSCKMKAAFKDVTPFKRAFNIEDNQFEEENPYNFELTVKRIGRIEPAELNEDFFKTAFPNGEVTSEDSLREKVADDIKKQYKNTTEQYFFNTVVEFLIDNVKVEIPEEFTKRYVKAVQKDMSDEDLEKQFDGIVRAFKWQLIENKAAEGEDVQVKRDDIEEYFRNYFIANYFGNFKPENADEYIDTLVKQAMSNQEYVKNAYDMLYDQKLMVVLRKKLKMEQKEGSFDDFLNAMKKESAEETPAEAPKKSARKKSASKEDDAEKVEAPAEEKPKRTRKSTKKSDNE